jgi:thiamine kinase-like enzyme
MVAARAGVAPPLAALQLPEGHSLSRFVEGLPLDASSVRESDRLERVGRVLRLMHDCGSIEGGWSVFDDVRRNVATARAESLDLPADLESLLARLERIEAMFATLGLHERLCHNDLQLQNVIDAGARLWVVDWEYAAMGNPYFDLGGFGVNAELGEDEEATVLAAYFGELRAADQARVRLLQVLSALREATWAVVAAPVLELDWDYAAWAAEYFDRARRQSEGRAFERRLGLATGGPR